MRLSAERSLRCLLVAIALGYPMSKAGADTLVLSAGAFSLSAKAQDRTSTIAGPGSYSVTYFRPMISHIQLMVSYSLMMSKVIGGDMGYGPDIGFAFYPLSHAPGLEARSDNVTFVQQQVWRPFVGGQFIQRQFQSVQSSYSGFQVSVGTLYRWDELFSLTGMFRFGYLGGPSDSSATESHVLFGIGIGL